MGYFRNVSDICGRRTYWGPTPVCVLAPVVVSKVVFLLILRSSFAKSVSDCRLYDVLYVVLLTILLAVTVDLYDW